MSGDDEINIRPGRIRTRSPGRGKSFVARVLAATSKGRRASSRQRARKESRRIRTRSRRKSRRAARPHLAIARRGGQGACRQTRSQGRAAGNASLLSTPRWRHSRWRPGKNVRRGGRRRGRSRLRRALPRRPASFPLHRLAGRRRGAFRPSRLHARSYGENVTRSWDQDRLGRNRSLEHRASPLPCPGARTR